MGKKGKNSKKEAEVAEPEKEIDWDEGTKKVSKKQLEKQRKQDEASEKKKEREQLLKMEEEVNASGKKKGKGKEKNSKKGKQAAHSSGLDDALNAVGGGKPSTINAEGLDDAIAALSLLKKDVVSDTEIDRHPERRFKAALAAYTERRLPELREENPGMRKRQLEELAYKEFQKSDENPLNKETNVAFNATDEDVQNLKKSIKQKRTKKFER
ncbi:DEKNAAC101450 [Brettanomyces naardenensis]|uniref:DEKNAAC101450 n=1 Tax=Brettanomyces naardenensis TaxID=13370 RepID=A0A448YI41_BRENA|nr:DEKNAAC101450 [Brettanomyces naardenensis]